MIHVDRSEDYCYHGDTVVAAAVNVTSRHLLISRAQLEDDADYECQVGPTESFPGLRSYVAKLTVQRNHTFLLT